MKITKAKLRQIVLEEAVKLEEASVGQSIASKVASLLLPGSGEYGQGSYASSLRNKEMEKRVYERTVKPYAQTYYDIGKEYGISPNLIAGIMMDEDIRRYPDLKQSFQQGADIFADIPGDDVEDTGSLRQKIAGQKRPAVGMGSLKLDSIVKDLSQNTNPATGQLYIDLNKEIGPEASEEGLAGKVNQWLKKPENAIKATAARLAFDRDRFNAAGRELNNQELATVYSDYKPSDSAFSAADRGNLATTMGGEWLKPEVKVPEVKVADEFGNVGYEDALVWAPEPEDGDRVKIPEGVILDMIKGAIRELL